LSSDIQRQLAPESGALTIVAASLAGCVARSRMPPSPLIDKETVIPYKHFCRALSGRNSAVECQLPKLDVTGSIPVARSIFFTQTFSVVQADFSGPPEWKVQAFLLLADFDSL
jgi:hypothetical protein